MQNYEQVSKDLIKRLKREGKHIDAAYNIARQIEVQAKESPELIKVLYDDRRIPSKVATLYQPDPQPDFHRRCHIRYFKEISKAEALGLFRERNGP